MSIRVLVLGVVVLGAAGQLACSTQADASQLATAGTASEPAPSPPSGEGQMCGGFGGIPCPEGLQCVDDPNDDCDPMEGGADCSGICVSSGTDPRKPRCEVNDPLLSYVSRDPEQCMVILFICPDDATQFFNECGCGCRTLDTACDYMDPSRDYVAMDPDQCAALRFVCEPGETAFFDSCGCGCTTAAP